MASYECNLNLKEKKMKKFLVLCLVLVIVTGCTSGKTVHYSGKEKVAFSENGIKVGEKPDNDPVIAVFNNQTPETVYITVAGSKKGGWHIESLKNKSLKLENLGGKLVFLANFKTLPSTSVTFNLDRGGKARIATFRSQKSGDKGSYSDYYSRKVRTPGKMMMGIHNSHLQDLLERKLKRN